ncbi:MAG: aminotransferase class III-fold pyridoxal phosphate-dependent enzyme, partial [Planctomycetota bacterium]
MFDFAQNLEADKAIANLNQCVAKNYKLYLEDPIIKAEGVWLYTRKGRKIFDGVSAYSAANLGHNHPLVAEMIRLCLNAKSPTVLGRFLPSTWLGLLGKKITEMTGFEKYIPTNGGVEAPETALKLARRWGSFVKKIEGTPEILWCTGAFHGRTITMTQFFNDEPEAYNGFGPFPQGFIEIPYGDINAVKKAITPKTAAILIEPIQGEGGINIPPDSFFSELRKVANENNFLIIFDEVQTLHALFQSNIEKTVKINENNNEYKDDEEYKALNIRKNRAQKFLDFFKNIHIYQGWLVTAYTDEDLNI